MKFYKDDNQNLFCFESDGSQDSAIGPNLVPISEGEAEDLRAKTLNNQLDYRQLRIAAYPPLTDYIDAVVKNDQAAIQKYIDDCLAVKLKYPKP